MAKNAANSISRPPKIGNSDKKMVKSKLRVTTLKKFYYQLNQNNLFVIFDWGIICPSSYIHDKKTSPDIQDRKNNFLLLADKEMFVDESKSQILLEIVLMENENPISTNIQNIFVFNKPLPVSRIKRIIYSDNDYWETLKNMVKIGSISFIPFPLGSSNSEIEIISVDEIVVNSNTGDYSESLSKFDRRMGALAFMKNTDMYYGNYSNYSEHYIDILNVLDPEIFKEIKSPTIHDKLSKLLQIIEDGSIYMHIFSGKKIDKALLIEFLEKHLNNHDKNAFDKLKPLFDLPLTTCKKKYFETLEKVNNFNFFIVAFLAVYGERGLNSSTPSQLKYQFSEEVKNLAEADILLAILGTYFGYKFLRAHDEVSYPKEDDLSINIEKNPNIKFRLDSLLDYLTIETIYQKTFNKGTADLASISQFAPNKISNSSELALYKTFKLKRNFICENTRIHDVEFYRIIKKDLKRAVLESIEKDYKEKITAKASIFSWIYRFFFQKGIIRIDGDIYVNKSDLLNAMKNELQEVELLDKLIELDQMDAYESGKSYR